MARENHKNRITKRSLESARSLQAAQWSRKFYPHGATVPQRTARSYLITSNPLRSLRSLRGKFLRIHHAEARRTQGAKKYARYIEGVFTKMIRGVRPDGVIIGQMAKGLRGV